jgi:hypothetical protein
MKSILAVLGFAALSVLAHAQSAKPHAKPDPFVGRWKTSHQLMVEIRADGTAEHTGNVAGVWKSVPAQTAERKYQIRWKGGLVVDAVILERSLKKYSARNDSGFKYTAERVEE